LGTKLAGGKGTYTLFLALAWLLQRSPKLLLIPGTSLVKHLRENLDAKDVKLTPEMVVQLDAIGGASPNFVVCTRSQPLEGL
jgi:pyridoxine 4-dehydrogenase